METGVAHDDAAATTRGRLVHLRCVVHGGLRFSRFPAARQARRRPRSTFFLARIHAPCRKWPPLRFPLASTVAGRRYRRAMPASVS